MNKTSNGMIREDKSDKPIYFHYLPPHVLERYGVHMLAGAKKHGSGNFLKGGYGKENYLDSLYRHLIELKQGKTNEDHAASIMFNIIGYMHEDWQDSVVK
jgi:hypothetical protein